MLTGCCFLGVLNGPQEDVAEPRQANALLSVRIVLMRTPRRRASRGIYHFQSQRPFSFFQAVLPHEGTRLKMKTSKYCNRSVVWVFFSYIGKQQLGVRRDRSRVHLSYDGAVAYCVCSSLAAAVGAVSTF